MNFERNHVCLWWLAAKYLGFSSWELGLHYIKRKQRCDNVEYWLPHMIDTLVLLNYEQAKKEIQMLSLRPVQQQINTTI